MNLGKSSYNANPGMGDASLPDEARINHFNKWLQMKNPKMYRVLLKKHPNLFSYRNTATGFYGLGETPVQATAPASTWYELASQAIKSVTGYATQKAMIKQNLELAKQGLPLTNTPPMFTQPGIFSSMPPNMMLYAGLGVAALAAFFLMRKK